MGKPNPAIMLDNPLSKIPTLVLEDGTVLIDSRRHRRISRQPRRRRPIARAAQGRQRWLALSRQALADGLLDLLVLWRNEREKPAERGRRTNGSTPSPSRLPPRSTAWRRRPDALERARSASAHIAVGCALSYLDFRFADLELARRAGPGLAAWHETFRRAPVGQGDGDRRWLRRTPCAQPVRTAQPYPRARPRAASWRGRGRRRSSPISAPTSSRSSGRAQATTRAAGGRRFSRTRDGKPTGESGLFSLGQSRQAIGHRRHRDQPRARRLIRAMAQQAMS